MVKIKFAENLRDLNHKKTHDIKMTEHKTASRFALGLLSVGDNLDRALALSDKMDQENNTIDDNTNKALLEGVSMTRFYQYHFSLSLYLSFSFSFSVSDHLCAYIIHTLIHIYSQDTASGIFNK